LLPRFEDARKRGFESFKVNKEHPALIYSAGLSESVLLRVLNVFGSALPSFRPSESRNAKQSSPSGNIQITSDWISPSSKVTEISARLEPLFEYDGLLDAAFQWRHGVGRLTFEDFFQRMRQTGRDDSTFFRKIIEAARDGDLRTFAPGQDFQTGHGVQDELYARDIDALLAKSQPHIKLRFSAASERKETIMPVSRTDANKAMLREAIKECGGDPNNLPNGQSGVPGLKAKVRKHVGATFTTATFNTTWKQVRRDAPEAGAADTTKPLPRRSSKA
jgi:hypothetical protein